MNKLKEAADTFLKLKKIAVVGVSSKGDVAANAVYKKLRSQGYRVYAVNPNNETVEGDPCFPTLKSIPDDVEGVVIGTHPDITPKIVDDCIETGVKHVWIHRSFGEGSYHPEAQKKAEEHGISLIPGGCPMMFSEPVDIAHKCFRWILKVSGKEAEPITQKL